MNNDIKSVIADEKQIDEICCKLGSKIQEDYKDKQPVFIGLLKGCQPFMSDLLKHFNTYCEIDYMSVSSYDGVESTGSLNIKKDIDISVKDKDVILVDDVVDTGVTASKILQLFMDRGAKSVVFCALLNKPEGRKVNVDVKYFGLDVPNVFVVGYGLDYNEVYRNLPYIGVLKEEIYE